MSDPQDDETGDPLLDYDDNLEEILRRNLDDHNKDSDG